MKRKRNIIIFSIIGLLIFFLFKEQLISSIERTLGKNAAYAQTIVPTPRWIFSKDTADSDKLKFFYPNKSASPAITVNTNGQVGISTSSPSASLDINGLTKSTILRTGGSNFINLSGGQGTSPKIASVVDKDTPFGLQIMTSDKPLQLISSRVDLATGLGNYLQVEGSTFGTRYSALSAAGVDSNVSIVLTPKGTGKVGIGTKNPTELLTIGEENTNSGNRKVIRLNSGGYSEPGLYNMASNGDKLILYNSPAGNYDARIGIGTRGNMWFKSSANITTGGRIEFWTGTGGAPVPRMTIAGDGRIGVGIMNPSAKLEVAGDLKVSSCTGCNSPSDKRLKKNVIPLKNALDDILKLQGVTFQWTKADMPAGIHIGFIAQDVEKVLPEVVHTDEKGYKSLEYGNMAAVLVEAIKEQQKEIELLKKEIQALKNK